ncbi:MAG: YeeE/YedE family protein [Alcaligenaceae bacterium]
MDTKEILLWSGLTIGVLFGINGQWSGFCLNRALKEGWDSGAKQKAQAFALALVVSIIGAQTLSALEIVDLSTSIYRGNGASWLFVILGGLMFGYGMMLANGCGARAVVLLGQGNLRSFVVLLCLGISAYMTLTGLLAPLRLNLAQATALPAHGFFEFATVTRFVLIAGLSIPLLIFVFWRGAIFKNKTDLLSGVVVGALITAGWWVTGWLGVDEFEPAPSASLTFIAPIGETIQYTMIATGMRLSFGVTVMVGVVLGSFLAAKWTKSFRLQGFETPKDMLRYMGGGTLMGIGGALAMGCSIGQGLTGFSTLTYASMLAFVAMILGARLAQRAL